MHCSPESRRVFLRHGVAAATAVAGTGLGLAALAQNPAEQTVVLCSGPAGSVPDLVARRVAEQLAGRHGQRAIVENRPGAAGQIAVKALQMAPADGSTLLLAQGAVATINPYLYARLPYDPVADLRPVSLAGEMTLALAVGPAVPDNVASVAGLLDWLRRNPRAANVGSPGTGTLPHLLEALLFHAAGVPWQHVAYAGGPPALVDLMGGQIAVLVLPEGLLRPHRAAGKLRVLATSGARRTAYLPDVGTLAEQGFPELVVREWFAFFMSARVPPAALEHAAQAVRAAIAQPALAAAFSESGMVAQSSTPAALAERIAAEQRMWEPLIRSAGIRAE